jgi:hypothetical protein
MVRPKVEGRQWAQEECDLINHHTQITGIFKNSS